MDRRTPTKPISRNSFLGPRKVLMDTKFSKIPDTLANLDNSSKIWDRFERQWELLILGPITVYPAIAGSVGNLSLFDPKIDELLPSPEQGGFAL